MNYQVRNIAATLRADGGESEPFIEGYFAVFDSIYDMGTDWFGTHLSESIDKGAFKDALDDDIRALINHNDTLVLGRTTAKTLELRTDDHGLWGRIKINPNDSDAMNLYARVKRGDVSQCSFGFDILEQTVDDKDNGKDLHWTIKAVKLYEVSPCTFPAYEETAISARKKDAEDFRKRSSEAWRQRTLKKLNGGKE